MFEYTENSKYIDIPIKKPLVGILSYKGLFRPDVMLEQLPIENVPMGVSPEMYSLSNSYRPSQGITQAGGIPTTVMIKNSYNNFGLFYPISTDSVYRKVLRKVLTKLSAIAQWKYVSETYMPMLRAIDDANKVFNELFVDDETLSRHTLKLVCEHTKLISAYGEKLLNLVNEILEFGQGDLPEEGWLVVLDLIEDSNKLLNNIDSRWECLDDMYDKLNIAYISINRAI